MAGAYAAQCQRPGHRGKEGTARVDSTSGQRVDSAREEGEGRKGVWGRGRVGGGGESQRTRRDQHQHLNAVLQSTIKRPLIQGSKAKKGGGGFPAHQKGPS